MSLTDERIRQILKRKEEEAKMAARNSANKAEADRILDDLKGKSVEGLKAHLEGTYGSKN